MQENIEYELETNVFRQFITKSSRQESDQATPRCQVRLKEWNWEEIPNKT